MKPRIRRFEPAGGVSRHMIETEAKYVAREAESYLRLSLSDLKQKVTDRGGQWHHADEALHAMVLSLPERDRLAVQCMLVRDQLFLLELYLEYLRTTQPQETARLLPPSSPTVSETYTPPTGSAHGPISEWLFPR